MMVQFEDSLNSSRLEQKCPSFEKLCVFKSKKPSAALKLFFKVVSKFLLFGLRMLIFVVQPLNDVTGQQDVWASYPRQQEEMEMRRPSLLRSTLVFNKETFNC